jgi:hypothetical protein
MPSPVIASACEAIQPGHRKILDRFVVSLLCANALCLSQVMTVDRDDQKAPLTKFRDQVRFDMTAWITYDFGVGAMLPRA